MTLEQDVSGRYGQWRGERLAQTTIASWLAALPGQRADEATRLMAQGVRLLMGAWDSADDPAAPTRALLTLTSLGLHVISLDGPGIERVLREGKGSYDIALALRTPATGAALAQRILLARRALRPEGTLVLATTSITAGEQSQDAGFAGPILVGDESEYPISLPELRGLLVAEGFIVRAASWQGAPTLAELAPAGRVLPSPRRLLVVASLSDGDESPLLRLRSA